MSDHTPWREVKRKHQTSMSARAYTYPNEYVVEQGFDAKPQHQELPILAHRSVRLLAASHIKGLRLMSAVADIELEPVMQAKCLADTLNPLIQRLGLARLMAPHRSPALGCTCGFYAMPTDQRLLYGDVAALVELSGRVIEHTHGYRAEWQKLVELRVQPCGLCGGYADDLLLGVYPGSATSLCDRCAGYQMLQLESASPDVLVERGPSIRLADLIAQSPIPVKDFEGKPL